MARKTNRDILQDIQRRITKSERKYEKKGFSVNIPSWYNDLLERAQTKGARITKKMLGEAEELAKHFKRTVVPKAEREAEKIRKKEERERETRYEPQEDYDYEEIPEEYGPPQEYDYDEIPEESSAAVELIINALRECMSAGSFLADSLLGKLEFAIEKYGVVAVGKSIEGDADNIVEAVHRMAFYEGKNNKSDALSYYNAIEATINHAMNGAEDMLMYEENSYGL